MNKLIKFSSVVAVIAILTLPVLLYAEEEKTSKIVVNLWGRAIFAPVIDNDNGEKAPTQGTSWGGDASRISVTVKGESKNAGFHVDMNCDGGNIGFHDQQKIWAKPVSFVTVEIGASLFYDELRGDAAFGAWNWMRLGGQDDEDAIFVRGKAGGGDQNHLHQNSNGVQGGWTRENGVYAGSIVHLDVEGLHIFAALDQSHGYIVTEDDSSTSDVNEEVRAKYSTVDMFKRGQYGAGYKFPGLGMIRAQYIGKTYLKNLADNKLTNYGIINAALKIDKLINNFYLDLGVFYPTEDQEKTGDSEGYAGLAAYLKYTVDAVTLHSTCQTKLDKKDKNGKEGTAIHGGIGADIAAGSFTFNTDFRYMNNNWNADTHVDTTLGFLFGVSKGFSNGKIGIGFEFCTTTLASNVKKEKQDDPMWAVPVVVEVWF